MDNFHAVFEIKGNLTRILFTNRADGNTVRAGYNRFRYKLRIKRHICFCKDALFLKLILKKLPSLLNFMNIANKLKEASVLFSFLNKGMVFSNSIMTRE